MEAKRKGVQADFSTWGKNLWVTAGKTLFGDALISNSDINLDYVGVGSGNTAPALGNTDLETPILRKQCANKHTSGGKWYSIAFFSSSEGTGIWKEAGLFVGASGGVMWARSLFAAPFTKDASKTATVTWINTPTESI